MIPALLGLALGAMAITAHAASGSYPFAFGNEYGKFSGSFYASGTSDKALATANVTLGAKGNVTVLKKSMPGVDVSVNANSKNGAGSYLVNVKLGGYTVDVLKGTTPYTWNKTYSRTLASTVLWPFWVGPIPLAITGSGSAAVNPNLAITFDADGVAVNGNCGVQASGNASVAFSFPEIKTRIEAMLEMLKADLGASVSSDYTTCQGQAGVTLNVTNSFVKFYFEFMSWKWDQVLFKLTSPYKQQSLIKF